MFITVKKMSRSTHILLVTLVFFCHQQEIKAASDPQKQETKVDIFLFADVNDYMNANPHIYLEDLRKVNNVGYTLGVRQEGDKELFQTEDVLYAESVYTPHNHPIRYQKEFKMEITYVEFHFVDNVNRGSVFLIDGGIGKSFILLLIETPSKIEGFVHTKMMKCTYGKDVEN